MKAVFAAESGYRNGREMNHSILWWLDILMMLIGAGLCISGIVLWRRTRIARYYYIYWSIGMLLLVVSVFLGNRISN